MKPRREISFLAVAALLSTFQPGPEASADVVAGTWAEVALSNDSGFTHIDAVDMTTGGIQPVEDRACVYVSHRDGNSESYGRTCGPAQVVVDAVAGTAAAIGAVDVNVYVCTDGACAWQVEHVVFEVTASAGIGHPGCGHSTAIYNPQHAIGRQGTGAGVARGSTLSDLGRANYSCVGFYMGVA